MVEDWTTADEEDLETFFAGDSGNAAEGLVGNACEDWENVFGGLGNAYEDLGNVYGDSRNAYEDSGIACVRAGLGIACGGSESVCGGLGSVFEGSVTFWDSQKSV